MPFPSSIPAVSVPTPSEFRGHPVLTLPNPDDASQPGLQFGLKKLRAVLAHLEAVRAFVDARYKGPKKVAVASDKLAALTALLAKSGVSADEIAKLGL